MLECLHWVKCIFFVLERRAHCEKNATKCSFIPLAFQTHTRMYSVYIDENVKYVCMYRTYIGMYANIFFLFQTFNEFILPCVLGCFEWMTVIGIDGMKKIWLSCKFFITHLKKKNKQTKELQKNNSNIYSKVFSMMIHIYSSRI